MHGEPPIQRVPPLFWCLQSAVNARQSATKGDSRRKSRLYATGKKKNGAFLGRRSVRTQSVAFKISSDDAHVRGLVRARDDRHGDDCANHDYDRAGRGDDDPSDESGHANGGDDHRCRCVPRWRPQALSTQQ